MRWELIGVGGFFLRWVSRWDGELLCAGKKRQHGVRGGTTSVIGGSAEEREIRIRGYWEDLGWETSQVDVQS